MASQGARPSTPTAQITLKAPDHPAPSPAARSPLAKRPRPSPGAPEIAPVLTPEPEAGITKEGERSEGAGMAAPTTRIADAPPLLVKKLVPEARAPTRGSEFAAGYDLYAAKDTVVPAKGKVLVKL